MSICDEKLLKLNERMDQPLPSYNKSQINRTRKVNLEQTLKSFAQNQSTSSKNNIPELPSYSNNDFCQKLEDNSEKLKEVSKNMNSSREESSLKNDLQKQTKIEEFPNQLFFCKNGDKIDMKKIPQIIQENSSNLKNLQENQCQFNMNETLKPELRNSNVKISNSSNSKLDLVLISQLEPQKNKITDYFIFNQSNKKQFNSFDELNQNHYQQNKEENKKQKIETIRYDLLLKDKNKEIVSMHKILQKKEEEFMLYKKRLKDLMCPMLKELEELKKQKRMNYIESERRRLGYCAYNRDSAGESENWVDGEEVMDLQKQLSVIVQKRQKVENLKKKIKKGKKNVNSKNEEFSRKSKEDSDLSNPFELYSDNLEENKNIINYQFSFLNKEEGHIKEKLQKIKKQKEKYIQVLKQFDEENHSRFGKYSNIQWPVLNERYQLLELLGKGGFSEVYKAFDIQELRFVACKIHQISKNWKTQVRSNYVKHALRENNVLKTINHINIIKHYDSVEIDQDSFGTILEYCDGLDLATYLKRQTVLSEKSARAIMKQVLSGLKFLNEQEQKIIHYDLKPQNILFAEGVVKLTDFGLCKIMEENETKLALTSQGAGTYWYLPPECFKYEFPQISTKVDVWSCGIIFYEMVYGQRPFGHDMSQERILKEGLMLKVLNLDFPLKPFVSEKSKLFIKKCLEFHQENRMSVLEAFNMMN